MKINIIEKLKKAGLTGRGGAGFPTAAKWELVKNTKADKKYIICNASEGEPGVKKDFYILKNYPQEVVKGIGIAIDFLGAEKAYIYINPGYYGKFKLILNKIIKDLPIEIFMKPYKAGYIGGEETSAINAIEGRRIEPRLRPPFPPTSGLWGFPTLVNNVETFYDVALIASGKYENKRFYTINGDCLFTGVYFLPEDWTVKKILKATNNYPDFEFFVQAGGDASGEVLNEKQLNIPAKGGAAITVYSVLKHKPINLIKKWLDFFYQNSCGQCVPCREGLYRLREIVNQKEQNWQIFSDILDVMRETAFCGLGCSVHAPITSYVNNVLSKQKSARISVSNKNIKTICDCFRQH